MTKNSIDSSVKTPLFFRLLVAFRLSVSLLFTKSGIRNPQSKTPNAFSALLLIGILTWPSAVFAQKTRAQLEREKKQNLARIAETNRILQETGVEKQASIGQLNALNEQITSHQRLINKMSEEVALLDKEIAGVGQMLTAMESDFANLQREYAAMLYAASKTTNNYNKILFLFSSNSFTEMLMRMKYLKQYSESRKEQLKQIETMRSALLQQRVALDVKKSEKRSLLASQLKESKNLLSLKDKQNQMVQKLNEKEQELSNELAAHKESVEKLDRLIAAVIAEEVRRTAERERIARERAAARDAVASDKKSVKKPASVRTAAAGATASSVAATSFEGAKSQLAWPVNSGFVSGHFGRQPHPVWKDVIQERHGIDIQTSKGEEVRAVYDGEVATITDIPGMHKLVMLKHGDDYFTVYAKLSSVSVEKGQKVKAKQVIGQVYTDREGTSELQFQIWHNQEKLNPEVWLQGK